MVCKCSKFRVGASWHGVCESQVYFEKILEIMIKRKCGKFL